MSIHVYKNSSLRQNDNVMRCYDVTCKGADDNATYHVGVMTSGVDKAKLSAEKTMLEGRHLKVIAVDAIETNAI